MKLMPNNEFRGPIFLVGMPRSGTKLLREMLNQHPLIRFSDIETDFFPYWVAHWAELMPSTSRGQFERFYADCLHLPFFIQNAERGIDIKCDSWKRTCKEFTPAAVFEGLMRCCLDIPADARAHIWGDKSPSYIRHIPLLIEQFPDARVVHIIRDVRDYALSMREAWGKSMLRASQRWQDDVSTARLVGRRLSANYMEICYEDLLAEPKATLVQVTTFLGVDLTEEMLQPNRIIENMGAAKSTSGILRGNTEKYRIEISPRLLLKIEQIAGTTLRDLGYDCSHKGNPIRLSRWRLWLLQLSDGWNLVLASKARLGLVKSVWYNLKYFCISGNRR